VSHLVAYNLYKTLGENHNHISDEELTEKLQKIQEELNDLQTEGERRFEIHKQHSDKEQTDVSNRILNMVGKMQNVVSGYLSSEAFQQTTIGEEISDIMKNDPDYNINSALSKALADVVSHSLTKSKINEDPENDIDFQIFLQKNDESLNFSNEYWELEESISNLEDQIGRPDINKQASIKIVLLNIINNLPKADPKLLTKCKQLTTMLKKEISDLIKAYNSKSHASRSNNSYRGFQNFEWGNL